MQHALRSRAAARQHGVVATRQIRALGLSSRVGHPRGRPRSPDPRPPRRLRGRPRAPDPPRPLAGRRPGLRPGRAARHHAAAALHELRDRPRRPIDVTASGPARHPGIRTHTGRAVPTPAHVDGIPVTTLERTLLDYAAVTNRRRLAAALDAAERAEPPGPDAMRAEMAAAAGHRGIGALTAELDQREPTRCPGPSPSSSAAFSRSSAMPGFRRPGPTSSSTASSSTSTGPRPSSIVEVDGFATHRGRPRFESDRGNDTIHTLAGRRTIRPT